MDAWQEEDNISEKIAVASPQDFGERCAVAETCVTKLGIQIPSVIDDISNSTELAYTAWPDRLYVIDGQGRIAYKSQPGPYGFKPDEVRETLKRLVPVSPNQVSQIR